MKTICILVPVAPFEPLSIIQKSVRSLSRLEADDIDLDILYIIDCPLGPDERTRYLSDAGMRYIMRSDTRGRRGGAINDGLDSLRKPDGALDVDFIALFDVDCRPTTYFIPECVGAIERDADAVIASGARYITNSGSGWVAKMIDAECSFFEDVYWLYERFDGFKQFNGLIGVIDARALDNSKLDEDVYCEDLEFMQRIYLAGKKAMFVQTKVGEQGPVSLKELYSQRVRWLAGALEGLEVNLSKFYSAPISVSRKVAWFTSLSLPFVAFLLTPIAPVYAIRLWSKGHDQVLLKTFGLVFHVWLISFCGAHAILNRVRKKRSAWTDTSRSDV